jgi:DNA-binding GntR family transcriptional regulator
MRSRSEMRATGSSRMTDALELESNSTTTAADPTYQAIFEAIIDHRIPPGQKLAEDKLVEALNTSRTRVREALTRLSLEKLVTIYPYRGAFVTEPSIEEARQVFAARKAVEVVTVRDVARRATRDQIAQLKECVAREKKAWSTGNRRQAIILSRRFHLEIAAMAGNAVLEEILLGLISRISIVIALYDRPGNPDCFFDEHVGIVSAVAENNEDLAADLIASHIQHMEDHLNLMESRDEPLDLLEVFRNED